MDNHEDTAPLGGIKVLEFGQIAAVPFLGSLLADLGADVVKVERPDGGDGMRAWPPLLRKGKDDDPYSANFAALNRNKRSITVDMKTRDGQELAHALACKTDILIENFRPGVLARLNLNYADLFSVNPGIIYCSLSGYGQSGPYRDKGAFDLTVQAMSGLMSVTGDESGPPVKCGVPVADFSAGLYGAVTILAALHRRKTSAVGAYIDCSMLGAVLGISALQTSQYFGTGIAPKRLGSAHPRNAPYQAYEASDGYFAVAAGTHGLWVRFCEIVQIPEVVEDQRFATQEARAHNQDALTTLLKEIFKEHSVRHWLSVFDGGGVPCAPINTFADILSDPHVSSMDILSEIALPTGQSIAAVGFPTKISDFEFTVRRAPPMLGEHTTEVPAEWLE